MKCIYCIFIFTFSVNIFKGFVFVGVFCTVIRYQVFQSNTNNLHTIVWFQVLFNNNFLAHIYGFTNPLSNSNNFQTNLFDI